MWAITLLAVVILLVMFPTHWWFWALMLGTVFATIEAAAEGRLLNFLSRVAIVLAVISALILAWEFWRMLVVITLGVAIALLIRDNLRELRRTPSPTAGIKPHASASAPPAPGPPDFPLPPTAPTARLP